MHGPVKSDQGSVPGHGQSLRDHFFLWRFGSCFPAR